MLINRSRTEKYPQNRTTSSGSWRTYIDHDDELQRRPIRTLLKRLRHALIEVEQAKYPHFILRSMQHIPRPDSTSQRCNHNCFRP